MDQFQFNGVLCYHIHVLILFLTIVTVPAHYYLQKKQKGRIHARYDKINTR